MVRDTEMVEVLTPASSQYRSHLRILEHVRTNHLDSNKIMLRKFTIAAAQSRRRVTQQWQM
jgi:hypothetical protein